MGANILSAPNLELDKEEAAKLASAVQKVASFYSVAFDPKKVAIFELAAVCGTIYGPRIMAWRIARKTTPKQSAPQPVETPKKQEPSAMYAPSQVFGNASGEL
jgi:hypothetical protein